MPNQGLPRFFERLLSEDCITMADVCHTSDGFHLVYKSLSDLLSEKGIFDFPDSEGERLACDRFFDDWFLYAVPNELTVHTYSLLKLREQEWDAKEGTPADGDTPGVTISFIAFDCATLLDCLADPTDDRRQALRDEIDRVVLRRGQRHHHALKRYFKDPRSQGSYLVATMYARYIAACAEGGQVAVPEHYKKIVQQSISYKKATWLSRLPRFIDELNQEAKGVICDNEKIYISDPTAPTEYETAAILATHTGNTSIYSFAAEVEYHAKFLIPLARIKIPFFGQSIYDSAIRADMTVGDAEKERPVPFYQSSSRIVRRQYALHRDERVTSKETPAKQK